MLALFKRIDLMKGTDPVACLHQSIPKVFFSGAEYTCKHILQKYGSSEHISRFIIGGWGSDTYQYTRWGLWIDMHAGFCTWLVNKAIIAHWHRNTICMERRMATSSRSKQQADNRPLLWHVHVYSPISMHLYCIWDGLSIYCIVHHDKIQ